MFEGNKKARLKNCFSGGLSRFFPRKTQTTPPAGAADHGCGAKRWSTVRCVRVFSADLGAAADRHAPEGDGAGAPSLAAGSQALAAALGQLAAVFVTGSAGDAHPLRGRFAGATAEAEIALGDADPVLRARATAHPLGEAPAEVLECAAGSLIGTLAVDFESIGGLFKAQRAPRHGAQGRCRSGAVVGRRRPRARVRTGS